MSSKKKRNIDTTAETESASSGASVKKKFKKQVTTTIHDPNTKRITSKANKSKDRRNRMSIKQNKKQGNRDIKDDVAASKTVGIKQNYAYYGVDENRTNKELISLSVAAKRAAAAYAGGKSANDTSRPSARPYVKQPWKQRDLQTNWKYSNKFNPRHEVGRGTANTWGRPEKRNTQVKSGPAVNYNPSGVVYANPESVATYLQCWKNDVLNWTHISACHTWLCWNLLCANKVSDKSLEIAMEYLKADGDFSATSHKLVAQTQKTAKKLKEAGQFTMVATDRFKRIMKLCNKDHIKCETIPATTISATSIPDTTIPDTTNREAYSLATNYLVTWMNDRRNWKFHKMRHIWLCNNIVYPTKVADEYFDIAMDYFRYPGHHCDVLALITHKVSKELKNTGELTQDLSDRIERIMKVCEDGIIVESTEVEKYLHTWWNDRPHWRFSIMVHKWLLCNLIDDKKIGAEYFDIAMKYFESPGRNSKLLAKETAKLAEKLRKTGKLSPDQSDRVVRIMKAFQDAKLTPTTAERYLITWKKNRITWKLSSKIQSWLSHHLVDDEMVADEYFNIALEYFASPVCNFVLLAEKTKELIKKGNLTEVQSARLERIKKVCYPGRRLPTETEKYLHTWKYDRPNWKFIENLHYCLSCNLVDNKEIGAEMFDIAMEYFAFPGRNCKCLAKKTQNLAEKLERKGQLITQDKSNRIERIKKMCNGAKERLVSFNAVQYLHTWKNDRPSWQFNTESYKWLSCHLVDDNKIADEHFDIAMDYFGSFGTPLRHCYGLVNSTQKLAEKLKKKDQLNKDRFDRIMKLFKTKQALTDSEQGNADNKKMNPEEPQDDDVEKSDTEIEKSDEEMEETERGDASEKDE